MQQPHSTFRHPPPRSVRKGDCTGPHPYPSPKRRGVLLLPIWGRLKNGLGHNVNKTVFIQYMISCIINLEAKMTKYYFGKTVELSFDDAIVRVTEELKKEGFGVLTEVDMQATLKKKLDVDFRPYKILGACNPPFAYKALQAEQNIGLLLPCNVIVQDAGNGKTEIAAIDPLVSMSRVENPALEPVATEIKAKLQRVIQNL